MIDLPVHQGWLAKARREITSVRDGWLAVRIAAWCCVLRVLKHVMPLPRLVTLVRKSGSARQRDARQEQRIVTLARWGSRLTQWSSDGDCFERALVTYRYLTAMNADPVFVVGLAPATAGRIQGHAWVVLDGVPLHDTKAALAEFEVMVSFGADGLPVAY
ncbi:MAG: lasso peptide biosynthesis B2 protein [Vicinamibacterales bacterium]